jgi:hypothetical protein
MDDTKLISTIYKSYVVFACTSLYMFNKRAILQYLRIIVDRPFSLDR